MTALARAALSRGADAARTARPLLQAVPLAPVRARATGALRRRCAHPTGRAVAGAALAWGADRALGSTSLAGAPPWRRTNLRGREVSLLSGPALALAVGASADVPRAAAAVAALGAAAVGRYDDVAGARHPGAQGVRGHLGALRSGRLTSGAVKVGGLAAVGLGSAALLERPGGRPQDLLVDGAVVAGAANLVNLLDLRPGRALKAAGTAALLLGQPGPAAAVAALMPGDLHERTMLGDCGANTLGALLGLALVSSSPQRRTAALLVLASLTAASEVVSCSRMIDAVPALRWVDRAGRLT